MKNILLIITSIISFFALAFLFLSYQEQPKSQFANYSELVVSGLIDAGWVTKYIPKSAIDIKEQHDIDTNMVSVSFNYEPNETEMVIDECNLLFENEKGKKYVCPPFEGETAILTLRRDGIGYYKSEHDGLY